MESDSKPPPACFSFLFGGRYFRSTRTFIEFATDSVWSRRRPPIKHSRRWGLLYRRENRIRFILILSGLGEQCALRSVLAAASALSTTDVFSRKKKNLRLNEFRHLLAETQTSCFWMKSDRNPSSLTSPVKFRIFGLLILLNQAI